MKFMSNVYMNGIFAAGNFITESDFADTRTNILIFGSLTATC